MKKLLILFIFIFPFSVFSAGDLSVKIENISYSYLPNKAVNIPFSKMTFSAKNDDVRLDEIVVQRFGLSSNEDIKSVRVMGDDYYRSRNFSVANDDLAFIRFYQPFVIPKNKTRTLTLTASLDSIGGSRTIILEPIKIVSNAQSFAQENNDLFEEKIKKTEIRSYDSNVIEYSQIPIKADLPSLSLEVWQRVGRFRLENTGSKTVFLEDIFLENFGVGDPEDIFYKLILTKTDNLIISQKAKMTQEGALFDFYEKAVLESGEAKIFYIWGKIKRRKNYSLNFDLRNSENLQYREKNVY